MKNKVKHIVDKEKVEDFIGHGKCCVNTAELLFRRARERTFPKSMYPAGILLLHGIELLLKAVLLLQGMNLPRTHSILSLYKKCAEKEGFHRGELWACIQLLVRWFASDTVEARYAVLEGTRDRTIIAHNTFSVITDELVNPLERFVEQLPARK